MATPAAGYPDDSDPAEATPYLKKDDDAGSAPTTDQRRLRGILFTSYVGGDWSALEALYSPTDNWRVIRPGQAVTTDTSPIA